MDAGCVISLYIFNSVRFMYPVDLFEDLSFFLYHVISCLSVELSCFEFILLKLFFLHVDVYAVI